MQQSFRGEPIKSVIDQIRHMGLRYPEESGDFALGYASFFEQRIEAHRQLNLQLFILRVSKAKIGKYVGTAVLNHITLLSHNVPHNLVAPLSGVHELMLHRAVGCEYQMAIFSESNGARI